MLLALDLSSRQISRVLTQAVRLRAKLEIEPRPEFAAEPLWGIVAGRDQDLLTIELLSARAEVPLRGLLGAMCDVRTILQGQLYLFETAIVDVSDRTAPVRITVTAPSSVRVANRRRFSRRSPADIITVRLHVPGLAQPIVSQLSDLSRTGIGIRAPRRGADEAMLIGDRVDVEFVLPWATHVYTIGGVVCSKTACHGADDMSVGLEFAATGGVQQASLELLRSTIETQQERLLDSENEA